MAKVYLQAALVVMDSAAQTVALEGGAHDFSYGEAHGYRPQASHMKCSRLSRASLSRARVSLFREHRLELRSLKDPP